MRSRGKVEKRPELGKVVAFFEGREAFCLSLSEWVGSARGKTERAHLAEMEKQACLPVESGRTTVTLHFGSLLRFVIMYIYYVSIF